MFALGDSQGTIETRAAWFHGEDADTYKGGWAIRKDCANFNGLSLQTSPANASQLSLTREALLDDTRWLFLAAKCVSDGCCRSKLANFAPILVRRSQ